MPPKLDIKPLSESERRMVEDNMPLAIYWARRYRTAWIDDDDARQLAMVGLTRAVQKFDPARGFKFSTYASFWIKQALKRECWTGEGSAAAPRRQAALSGAVSCGQGGDYMAHESVSLALSRGVREQAQLDAGIDLAGLLAYLPARERVVITRRFGLGQSAETLDAVARDIGLTREGTRQVQLRALRRMRAWLLDRRRVPREAATSVQCSAGNQKQRRRRRRHGK